MKLSNDILKVGILQYEIQNNQPEKNLEKIQSYLYQNKADVVVLPEMGITGFSFSNLKEHLGKVEFYIEEIKKLSIRNNVVICTTLPFAEKEFVYNRLFFIMPNGMTSYYDKNYLIDWGGFLEKKYFSNGKLVQVIQYRNWLIGFAICYDLRFPELFYHLNKYSYKTYNDFVKIILIPSQWPKTRVHHFVQLARARAIENLCYVVCVNIVGRNGDLEFNGNSQVIDPDGKPLLLLNEEEGLFEVSLDLDYVNQLQKERPVLKDRFFLTHKNI